MKTISLVVAAVFCVSCTAQSKILSLAQPNKSLTADPDVASPVGGYVVGNFGISAQIQEMNGPHMWIKVNPPKLGVWLQSFAQGDLWIRQKGQPARELHLSAIKVSRLYPEYEAIFDAEGKLQVKVSIFAPIGLDAKIGFLPALIVGVKLSSERAWSGEVGYTLVQAKALPDTDDDATPWSAAPRTQHVKRLAAIIRGPALLALTGAGIPASATRLNSHVDTLSISAPIEIEGRSDTTVSFIVGAFDANGAYAVETATPEQMIASIANHIETLRVQLRRFEAALPRTGDSKIDEYTRWYTAAGILLTKGDRDGDVLTMGYRELNQRDSFWTTGIHLVFWRDLERRMLLESIQGQTPSGRVPTTILPTIDRGDEIDSSEYFVLRVARYYRWYRDDQILTEAWPTIRKAIDYLISRDAEHVGIPMQTSYWADWKDVPGEEGRKYAPHFALLWVAALRSASELAVDVRDPVAAEKYGALADRAEEFMNRSFDEGGMWNGKNYVDRWEDGRRPGYLLEDQVVGGYFNVIPEDKLNSIYQQLKTSETPWGVRETFPYIPRWTEESGGAAGNYHNGGIWPWLNFVDAMGRYTHRRAEEAEQILREVGEADLDADGDKQPGEFLNGVTGANRGFPIQGWDADLFSTIYFGAFGVDRTSRSDIAIRVHIPEGRDFSTRLTLPACTGTLSRKAKQMTWIEDGNQCAVNGIKVSFDANP